MQGFQMALNEYEAKMTDPFGNEVDETVENPDDWVDYYEEMLLEQQVEGYVRGW